MLAKTSITLLLHSHHCIANVLIKVKALQEAKASNPVGRWWIKADACDVRCGLRESVKGLWSGDEDLGDGVVNILYSEYVSTCNELRLCAEDKNLSLNALNKIHKQFLDDIEFLEHGTTNARKKYEATLTASQRSDKTLMNLAWDLVGFEELTKQANGLKSELDNMINNLKLGLRNLVVSALGKNT